MKSLIFLLFPSISFAQTLKPGLYRDLKPDKPIVLDTGSYTFIHLEMKNLAKGVWLDGSKAKSLTLQGWKFHGNGVWVHSSGDFPVCQITFKKTEVGKKLGFSVSCFHI